MPPSKRITRILAPPPPRRAKTVILPPHAPSAPAGGAGRPPERRGTAIGKLKRRGWPIAVKLSFFSALLTAAAGLIFGAMAVHAVQTRLQNEIVNSGYSQLLTLSGFAQKVMERFRDANTPEEFQRRLNEYREKASAADSQHLRRILEREPRVCDVALFAASPGAQTASIPVLYGGAAPPQQFAAPHPPFLAPSFANADPEVKIYRGEYYAAGNAEGCLYFRMPVYVDGPQAQPGVRPAASLNLILSAREIRDEVRALTLRLAALILGFVLLAGALSAGLARVVSRPLQGLVADMHEVARGNLEHSSSVPHQTGDEIGLLAMAFNQMTRGLRTAREHDRERERIAGELAAAQAVHMRLLPEKLPEIPGMDLYSAYRCAMEVGGDYYDVLPLNGARWGLCVADVSGKGIPGSMVMGATRTLLRLMAREERSAAAVLAKTNALVAGDIKRGMFVTCAYCVLDPEKRELSVASAGHNPLLLLRAAGGAIEEINPPGIALGFDRGPLFDGIISEAAVPLEPGDRVLLYTDGVTEARDEQGREWSLAALKAFTLKHAALPSQEFVERLMQELDAHRGRAEQHDDITVLTLKVGENDK